MGEPGAWRAASKGHEDGWDATYRADRPGQAVLVSGTRKCLIFRHPEGREVTSRICPVATVIVVP